MPQELYTIDWSEKPTLKSVQLRAKSAYYCPKCHYAVPIESTHINYEKEVQLWEEQYNDLISRVDRLTTEAGQIFDVPLREYWEACKIELIAHLKELQKRLEQNGY